MTIVREFHHAFNLPAPTAIPLEPDVSLIRLRARLIREEYEEVMDELAYLAVLRDPLEIHATFQRLLKELADLRYVVEGCAVSFALPIEEAYREVHRSNMSKLGPAGRPIYDDGGKVLKGPGYDPADMTKLVPDITDIEGEDITP